MKAALKEPNAQRTAVYLTRAQRDFIAQQAWNRGISRSSLIRLAVTNLCGDFPKE